MYVANIIRPKSSKGPRRFLIHNRSLEFIYTALLYNIILIITIIIFLVSTTSRRAQYTIYRYV